MKTVLFAVNGTLMRGLELEPNLRNVGAVFVREDKTAPCYRLWSIDDKHPAMLRVDPGDPMAVSVDVELWQVSYEGLTTVLLGEPQGLSVGKVPLANGETVLGVIAEPALLSCKQEISAFGGWRNYLASR